MVDSVEWSLSPREGNVLNSLLFIVSRIRHFRFLEQSESASTLSQVSGKMSCKLFGFISSTKYSVTRFPYILVHIPESYYILWYGDAATHSYEICSLFTKVVAKYGGKQNKDREIKCCAFH